MDNRINWIDWAKAIGITLVVLGHCQFDDNTTYVKTIIYSFHMPLFFFISGFLHKQKNDYKTYIIKNIKSILIPYCLLNLLAFIIFLPYNVVTEKDLFLLIKNTFLGTKGSALAGGMWFLLCIFHIKAVCFFIMRLKSIIYQIVILIMSVIICYTITHIFRIQLPYSIDTALMALPIYMIGYYFSKKDLISRFSNIPVNIFLSIILFIALLAGIYINGNIGMYSCSFGKYVPMFYLNATIGCLMVIFFCTVFKQVNFRLIQVVSAGTLLILALHRDIIGVLYLFIPPNIYLNVTASVLIIILSFYPILLVQKHFPILIGNRK